MGPKSNMTGVFIRRALGYRGTGRQKGNTTEAKAAITLPQAKLEEARKGSSLEPSEEVQPY